MPAITPPSAARRRDSLIDRAWARAVRYPYAHTPYRDTATIDLLRTMRQAMRLAMTVLAAFLVFVVVILAGFPVPVWLVNVFAGIAVVEFTFANGGHVAMLSLYLLDWRKEWAAKWVDVGVRENKVALMLRSPISPTEFSAYAVVITRHTCRDKPAGVSFDEDSELSPLDADPRIVWACHARNISPTLLETYLQTGLSTPAEAIRIHDHDITPAEWQTLRGVVRTDYGVAPTHVLTFLKWARTSHLSWHPSEFKARAGDHNGTLRSPYRSIEDILPSLRVWFSREGVLRTLTLDPHGKFQSRIYASATIDEWVEMTGSLAPFFIALAIPFREASEMVATTPPTIESLSTLLALNSGTGNN